MVFMELNYPWRYNIKAYTTCDARGTVRFHLRHCESRGMDRDFTPKQMMEFVTDQGLDSKFLLGRRKWHPLTPKLARKLEINL